MDEERLRAERADRKSWKSRVTGINEHGIEGHGHVGSSSHPAPRRRNRQGDEGGDDDNDLEMRLALEASKNEMEEDKKRRQSRDYNGDDDDLAKAIRLSKEEEELRRRELENQNAQSLFDDGPVQQQQQPQQQPQFTGWNQGYQQGGAVDLFGNPVYQQQQPQSTGFLDNAYAQNYQQTGFQDGFQNQSQGFDAFGQPQSQFMQPQHTIQPQLTAFNTVNPYSQTNADFSNLSLQQQQPPQEQAPLAGSHNPWAMNAQSQDTLKPLPTGSNNPFASRQTQQQPPPRAASQPTLSSLAEQRAMTQFTNNRTNPILNYSAPQQQAPPPQQQQQPPPQQQQQAQPSFAQHTKPMDPHHERLNQLLASGEGMDTFGNTGETRIPAQHTAPGTFVNSAGHNLNRLHSIQTGNNPFFAQPTGFAGQQNRMPPAQTGPGGQLGGFGQGSGGYAGQQQNGGAGGSLIDL